MIRQPLDRVWSVMRDRLPEIAGKMEDLDSIVVLERSTEPDGRLRLTNRWNARQQIPALLQGALGAKAVNWLDRAVWDDALRQCTWSIEPSVLAGHIECGGTTRYEPAMAGRGTRVTFEGYFTLKAGFLEGLPGAFEPAIAGFAETIVSSVIPRNLSRAVAGAGELIAAENAAANQPQPSK
jgi:hypothetical protein